MHLSVPHVFTHVDAHVNPHVCTYVSVFTCLHKCVYTHMSIQSTVQGVSTNLRHTCLFTCVCIRLCRMSMHMFVYTSTERRKRHWTRVCDTCSHATHMHQISHMHTCIHGPVHACPRSVPPWRPACVDIRVDMRGGIGIDMRVDMCVWT